MNKTQLIKKAQVLLSEYEALDEDKRNYDNENYHVVNVKRYNDYVDIDKLLKEMKVKKKFRQEILDTFTEDYVYDIYTDWLEFAGWRQLNYEVDDIGEITEEAKDEHKSFEYIELQGEVIKEDYKTICDTCHRKTWYEKEQKCKCEGCTGTLKKITYKQEYDDRKYIYAMGRSGGWACFQDTISGMAEELEGWIEDIKTDGEYYPYKDFKEDIIESIKEIEQAIEEINYLKNFIKEFNKSLDFSYEIKDRIEAIIGDLEEEEENRKKEEREEREETKSLQEDETRFRDDLKAMAINMQVRIDEFAKNKSLKDNFQRHLTGIIKLTK